ncbi:MAG: nucleotidyltransferase family protein [Candidatus Bathyarchaeota archaeon]
MKAVILAGGYAQRLKPLTNNKAKPLLKVAGKPVIDYILEKVLEIREKAEIDEIIISTNLKFEAQFKAWLKEKNIPINARIEVERSTREEEKPGAVAAIASATAENTNVNYLIIAGDNIFTDSLQGIISFFKDKDATTLGVYDVKRKALAKEASVVVLDSDGKVVKFIEKPKNPDITLVGTCIYVLHKCSIPLLHSYVKLENVGKDQPGRFIEWLYTHQPVYGYVLSGYWNDIGTPQTYREVNNLFKRFVRR